MAPSGRCRMHGGASLFGIASPSYRHGFYSPYLPKWLLLRTYLENEARRERIRAIVAAESAAAQAKRDAATARREAWIASLTAVDLAPIFAMFDEGDSFASGIAWLLESSLEPSELDR